MGKFCSQPKFAKKRNRRGKEFCFFFLLYLKKGEAGSEHPIERDFRFASIGFEVRLSR